MKIEYNEITKDQLEIAESLLFNGNGLIGLRNNLFEEYYTDYDTNRETYINGFYEESCISYPEKCFGFSDTNDTMLSVIDFQTVHVYIGELKLNYHNYSYSEHKRFLNIKNGLSVRSFVATDMTGNKTKILHERLVSFVDRDLIIERFKFQKLNHDLQIDVVNDINFKPLKTIDFDDPRVTHNQFDLNVDIIDLEKKSIAFSTKKSKLKNACSYAYNHEVDRSVVMNDKIKVYFLDVENTFIKSVKYNFGVIDNYSLNFDYFMVLQKNFLDVFWENSFVEIKSDEEKLESSVNYGSYALLQSTGIDGCTSISAKGLSGSGYEGHYFWDSEMYVFPVFLYTNPEIARNLLMYRINKLDLAIKNRSMVGYEIGALYPWRTISGRECSSYFLAGMAQHHINADICYALISYVEITDDQSILNDGGFEMLYQTSLLYASIMYFNEGFFHLDNVTGPDEYSVLVNDNYYTNALIAHQMKYLLKYNDNKLSVDEVNLFNDIANNIYLGYDVKNDIIVQDHNFLNLKKWPSSKNLRPLLMNYHPLEIYRHQVSKQADAVLALMLLPDLVNYDTLKNTVLYYDSVTTHDSSLSYSAFATIYARLGMSELADDYFSKNATTDLNNLHLNTKDGIHTACMGGTYITILYGFLNVEFKNGISIKPNFPKSIKAIKLKIMYQGDKYLIEASNDKHAITKIS